MLAVLTFIVGSTLQTAAVNYPMLTVARLIGGIGIGILSAVAPLYISEISPPEIRGTLLVLEEFSIVAGIVIAFWITYGTRFIQGEWAWRLPFLLQMVPAFVLGAGTYWLPFSPRYDPSTLMYGSAKVGVGGSFRWAATRLHCTVLSNYVACRPVMSVYI